MNLPPPSGPTLSLASWEDAERLFYSRRTSVVTVDQPLLLVTQLQRSGGTLLNSLLDGHPELHVHPYELQIGHPTKYDWPSTALAQCSSEDQWLDVLSEPRLERMFREGYLKVGNNEAAVTNAALPFTVVPSFVERLFRVLCVERPPTMPRQMLDHYFTAFFNAWFDYVGLRSEPKRWVVGFAPRLAWGANRQGFVTDYPDGRQLSVLRDPRGWYASARVFANRFGDLDAAIKLWRHAATEIAAAKEEAPNRVLVVSYEGLVAHPEDTMRRVAEWLGIAWDPILSMPTFNRLPTLPNSSFAAEVTGVRAEHAERWRSELEPEIVTRIERELMALHAEVAARTGIDSSSASTVARRVGRRSDAQRRPTPLDDARPASATPTLSELTQTLEHLAATTALEMMNLRTRLREVERRLGLLEL